jgi:hypothetical protein
MTDLKARIVGELYTAFERLDADEERLSIVGSWRDTLNDATILLRDYNAGRPTLHRARCKLLRLLRAQQLFSDKSNACVALRCRQSLDEKP